MEIKPRKKVHYVNNKDLYAAMVVYKEKLNKAKNEGKTLPKIPDYVGMCFLKICNKLSTKPNFMGYSYRDEMVADAIENCVSAAHSFDPEKSTNPFAYFTQIAWNAFIRRIAKEKKQAYIKHKNFINSNLMDSLNEEISITGTSISNDYSDDIIRNFEDKLVKVSKKNKIGLEKFIEEEKNEQHTLSTSECN
jgi:DNA-directed RNA polymerase specialized sigma24 family protein